MNNIPFTEQFAQSWQEWLTYRKERRLPAYKPMGLQKTLSRLIQLANNNEAEAIAIIDYSISQNYQGLFKEKRYGTSINKIGTSAARIEAFRNWGTNNS
jgi:hypothetical protein